MGPVAFISSSNLCDLMPGPFDSFQWALAGLQRGYIHPPASKRKGKIEPTQRDRRIGKPFPRAILNLVLYCEPVNRKQLIQEQWGLLPTPSSPKEAFSCADGWLAYPVCFVFSFTWCYFLLTLYIAFLPPPPVPRSELPNVGGQGVVAGLSKDAGATDSFPQVNGLLLSPWQCSLLVMVGTRMVFAQKYQLFNESSGSRFKGESREYALELPRQGSQKCTSLLNSPVSGHLLFKVASFFSHKDGHSLPEPSTARGHLFCFSDVTVFPEQIICRKALLSRNSSGKTGWSFVILEPSTSLRG